MKEITLHKDLTDINFSIIAEKYQRVSQYGNMGAQLLHKNKCVVYVEDNGADKTEYLLDKKEREAALRAPDLCLAELIWEGITNSEDPQLAFCQWYPETIKHDYWGDDPCKVLIVGCFIGYEPIEWAKNDAYEDIVFSSPYLAQDWIDEQEKGTYYLQHGEAGRPEYFIIS